MQFVLFADFDAARGILKTNAIITIRFKSGP